MASKDKDGNFVSADSIHASGDHKQERIPDEKVCSSYLIPCLQKKKKEITYLPPVLLLLGY